MVDQYYQMNDIVEGIVTKVQTYGAFLNFANGQTGLLHISEISDKFVRNVHQFCPLGSKLKVQIIEIDEANHFLRLSLKRMNHEESVQEPPKNNRKQREKINDKDIDFTSLENRLPEWIQIVHQRKE